MGTETERNGSAFSKERAIIGIDPGQEGAIAVLYEGKAQVYDTPLLNLGRKHDYDVRAMRTILLLAKGVGCTVFIESVHSMPKQGVVSSFSFGRGFGLWEGLVVGLELPYQLVTPQRWTKTMLDGLPKGKDTSRMQALRLFPDLAPDLALKRHHGRADALLIAEYGRRLLQTWPSNALQSISRA